MLLRGNPNLPLTVGWFVLQDAPVPKHTDVMRPTARIAPWISRGNSSPLESWASWIPWERITRCHGIPARKIPYLYRPPPARRHPFRRAAVRVPPVSKSYFSSLLSGQRSVHRSRNCCPSPSRRSSRRRHAAKRGENRMRTGVLEIRSAVEVPFRWFKL